MEKGNARLRLAGQGSFPIGASGRGPLRAAAFPPSRLACVTPCPRALSWPEGNATRRPRLAEHGPGPGAGCRGGSRAPPQTRASGPRRRGSAFLTASRGVLTKEVQKLLSEKQNLIENGLIRINDKPTMKRSHRELASPRLRRRPAVPSAVLSLSRTGHPPRTPGETEPPAMAAWPRGAAGSGATVHSLPRGEGAGQSRGKVASVLPESPRSSRNSCR